MNKFYTLISSILTSLANQIFKKNYILTLFLTLLIFGFSFGQEMLVNGDLEAWDNSTTPSGWDKAESLTQEATEVHGGSSSALRNGGSGTKDLAQNITGIVAGNSYTISFWYKIDAASTGNGARIWSSWKQGTQNMSDDVAQLHPASYVAINGNVWSQFTLTLNAPSAADGFDFEVRSYSNSIVYFDDLSFVNNTAPTLSTINLNTTGGSFSGERWVSITTAINGGGTLVWGQNNCTSYTSSSCRGALVNTDVDIAPGTYYVNCYDSYGDGWGSGNNFTVTAYGSTLASANVGDDDASGDNLEVSLMIVVVAPPSCLPPTALSSTNLTATSADLGWTAGGTETVWELVWGVQGDTPGSATSTLVAAVSTNPYTLTGLTANTTYDYYVKADCGFATGSTDLSTWAGPFTFTTACLSVSTFPYLESFETITSGQPDCWSIEGTTTTSSYHFNSFTTGQTGRGMRFNSYSNSNGRTSELITPEFDASALTTLELAFQSVSYTHLTLPTICSV